MKKTSYHVQVEHVISTVFVVAVVVLFSLLFCFVVCVFIKDLQG